MLCNSGLGFIKIKAVKKVRAQRRNEFMTIVWNQFLCELHYKPIQFKLGSSNKMG